MMIEFFIALVLEGSYMMHSRNQHRHGELPCSRQHYPNYVNSVLQQLQAQYGYCFGLEILTRTLYAY